MLRALSCPKVLICVPPLRHRSLSATRANDLVWCPYRSQILVLLLRLVKQMIILLESLRARCLLGVRSHLLLRPPEQQLVRVMRLRDHLGMVVLTNLQAIRGRKRWLQ